MNDREFYMMIRTALSDNPERLTLAIQAISDGQADYIKSLNKQLSECDRGLLAAVALLKGSCKKSLSDQLTSFIRRGLLRATKNVNALSPIEREFLKETEHLEV